MSRTASGGDTDRGYTRQRGGVAQLVEHLLCKQGVVGSSPIASTEKLLRHCAIYESPDHAGRDLRSDVPHR
jgi:hypothetical protein